MKIIILILPIYLSFSGVLLAQFYYLGDAQPMEKNCIMLTPDQPYREGIAYSTSYLNLDFNFEIEFDIFLGDKDEGADGIAFVIQKDPRKFEAFGTFGECLGYGRWVASQPYGTCIAPSIAIEFDTYCNPTQNDPACDHIAYLENGASYHTQYWNDNNDQYNLEDGRLHTFIFKWNTNKRVITVKLDEKIVYENMKDLKTDIFHGESQVIWGFTASTGRKHNLQYFCLKKMASANPDINDQKNTFYTSTYLPIRP